MLSRAVRLPQPASTVHRLLSGTYVSPVMFCRPHTLSESSPLSVHADNRVVSTLLNQLHAMEPVYGGGRQQLQQSCLCIISSRGLQRTTQPRELTEFIVLASTVLAVMTELPVSSTACRALTRTVLLPTRVTLLMGTTQCLR